MKWPKTLNSETRPVAVVIVNHNAGELLAQCVMAALSQAEQVIVVDNASSDSSMNTLAESFFGEARLILHFEPVNRGFSAGCNIGVKLSTLSTILFLNPDCILHPGALTSMHYVMQSTPGVGMVGGLLVNPDGSEQDGGRRGFPTPWHSFVKTTGLVWLGKYWPKLFSDFNQSKQAVPELPIPVEAISGAFMMTRRSVLSEIGLWDEDYFMHCEDLDLCMRLRQKGWTIYFVPDAIAVHHQGTCSRDKPVFVAWHKHKGMLRFYKKFLRQNHSSTTTWLITTGVWLRFSFLIPYYTVRRVGKKVINQVKSLKC